MLALVLLFWELPVHSLNPTSLPFLLLALTNVAVYVLRTARPIPVSSSAHLAFALSSFLVFPAGLLLTLRLRHALSLQLVSDTCRDSPRQHGLLCPGPRWAGRRGLLPELA